MRRPSVNARRGSFESEGGDGWWGGRTNVRKWTHVLGPYLIRQAHLVRNCGTAAPRVRSLSWLVAGGPWVTLQWTRPRKRAMSAVGAAAGDFECCAFQPPTAVVRRAVMRGLSCHTKKSRRACTVPFAEGLRVCGGAKGPLRHPSGYVRSGRVGAGGGGSDGGWAGH